MSAYNSICLRISEIYFQNPALVEEVSRKYIETFNGGKDAEDKCSKCSGFNKHYHCLAEGCKLAHR